MGPGIAKTDVEVHYVYCKSNGVTISNDELQTELVNAGVYGVRSYVTVKAPNGQTYLVWQSIGGTNSPPPLHLYIQRRFVLLRSKSATNSDSAYWDSEEELLKCEVLFQAVDPAKAEDPDEIDVLKYWYKYVGVYDKANDTFAEGSGFVGDEGVVPIWSANAFRRSEGTSKNMYSYEFKTGTNRDNYNIYVMYGFLTVE